MERHCNSCRSLRPESEFFKPQGGSYKTCSPCRQAGRERYRERRSRVVDNVTDNSTAPGLGASATFTTLPPAPIYGILPSVTNVPYRSIYGPPPEPDRICSYCQHSSAAMNFLAPGSAYFQICHRCRQMHNNARRPVDNATVPEQVQPILGRRRRETVEHQQRPIPARPAVRLPKASIDFMTSDPSHIPTAHNCGNLDNICPNCRALHFRDEARSTSGRYNSCCNEGKVVLDAQPTAPAFLQMLLTEGNAQARHYRDNINSYNTAMAFVSCRYTRDTRLDGAGPITSFVIQGEVYHQQGALTVVEGTTPRYAQAYLFDPRAATGFRLGTGSGILREDILDGLAGMLEESQNPFIRLYRTCRDILDAQLAQPDPFRLLISPQMRLVMEQGSDSRRTNLPTADEVAVVIRDEQEGPSFRDIVVAQRMPDGSAGPWDRIDSSHAAYMPLAYPLLFPFGTAGWRWSLALRAGEGRASSRNRLTQQQYYRYIIFRRNDANGEQLSTIHLSRRLFQKYIVDAYAIIDQERLQWMKNHQSEIRADLYNNVVDTVALGDSDRQTLGRKIILPASYTGGDRFMSRLYQNSMAIVRYFGKPTLFITMTANPRWPEITRNLRSDMTAMDDPSLAVTVFNIKLKALIQDLKTEFGGYQGMCWTVEYQKRGLPHAHILLFLSAETRFLDERRIDQFIRAEFPEPELDPDNTLRSIVESTMLHGPCGEHNPRCPCMKKNKHGQLVCSKGFPKAFSERTVISEDGYAQYRRRSGGYKARKTVGQVQLDMGNEWVVPYSPYLSRKYEAHINVEVCLSLQAVKYLHKYVYKGEDRTTVRVSNTDEDNEVAQHLNGRYIGPMQAAYQIHQYPTHREDPPVQVLQVHLPNHQPVYFRDGLNAGQIAESAAHATSTLMAFLEYNRLYEDGREYLYQEFPEHYVFKKDGRYRGWAKRRQGRSIGRMVFVSPSAGDIFYLRMLLTIRRGPRSFEDLLTHNGVQHSTFKAACIAMGMLENDQEWRECLTEACQWATGNALRSMFVSLLINSDATNPGSLWEEFKDQICRDLIHSIEVGMIDVPSDFEDPHLDLGLFRMAEKLRVYEKSLSTYGLPEPVLNWNDFAANSLIAAELNYDMNEQRTLLNTHIERMNHGQRQAYDLIISTVETTPHEAHFFVQGPGGTGKTFLYHALCQHFRSRGRIVLCVASSEISALLLPGGSTAHSRFKIPISCFSESTCNIPAQSKTAALIRRTSLIIWDEAPMQHKYNVTAVDKTLRDLTGNENKLFGGIPVVFGGDFAQTLPVVAHGNRAAQVSACLQECYIWDQLQKIRLTQNMRLGPGEENTRWASWIASMSYNPSLRGRIRIPIPTSQIFDEPEGFRNRVFPDNILNDAPNSATAFSSRAILAPHNDTVTEHNQILLGRMPGIAKVYHSADTVDCNDDSTVHTVPAEYLARLNPSGFPLSVLELKLGAPIMLLRNLLPQEGLCNGTRLIVTRLHERCIEAKILDGQFKDTVHILYRVKLSSNEGEFPWIITRKQFPIRLCFAITINKSQGQSLNTVGVDLRRSCFSHGQLYVALSRVTNVGFLSVLVEDKRQDEVENVVYPEVLL